MMSNGEIRELEEDLKKDADNTNLMISLGMAYLKNDKFEEAEKVWEQAGKKGSAEAFYNLGVLYGMIYFKDISEDQLWEIHSDEEMWFEKAEIAYQATLDLDPRNIHAMKNMASLYAERGQKEDSLALLERIIKISDDEDLIKDIKEEIEEIKSL